MMMNDPAVDAAADLSTNERNPMHPKGTMNMNATMSKPTNRTKGRTNMADPMPAEERDIERITDTILQDMGCLPMYELENLQSYVSDQRRLIERDTETTRQVTRVSERLTAAFVHRKHLAEAQRHRVDVSIRSGDRPAGPAIDFDIEVHLTPDQIEQLGNLITAAVVAMQGTTRT